MWVNINHFYCQFIPTKFTTLVWLGKERVKETERRGLPPENRLLYHVQIIRTSDVLHIPHWFTDTSHFIFSAHRNGRDQRHAPKKAKTNRSLNSGFDRYVLLRQLGAARLSSSLQKSGSDSKKTKRPPWVPRENIGSIEKLEKPQCCITRLNKVEIEFSAPCHVCERVRHEEHVCHWLVWFSSNVVTRARHLVGVQSKCHCDQCWAVGVAFHIRLWHSIDVECLKWILTGMTHTIQNKTH